MVSFEAIYPVVKAIATRYANRCRNITADDLVNEVFVTGYWRNTKKEHIRSRIHFDIKSYLRKCNGGRRVGEVAQRAAYFIDNPFVFSSYDDRCHGDLSFIERFESEAEPNYTDSEDWFKYIMEYLVPQSRRILRLRYVEDLTMKEIGNVIGMSESRVSQKMTEIHKVIVRKLRRDQK